MYAAIEEPGQVYTDGSETYAQIQQTTAADGTHYPPQPPSVDRLKQVAQVHSRQGNYNVLLVTFIILKWYSKIKDNAV